MFDIGKQFEAVYVGACETEEDCERCDRAEQFVFTALLDCHDLPHIHSSRCCFTASDLAKQVEEEEVKDIWAECLEKFPPKS